VFDHFRNVLDAVALLPNMQGPTCYLYYVVGVRSWQVACLLTDATGLLIQSRQGKHLPQ